MTFPSADGTPKDPNFNDANLIDPMETEDPWEFHSRVRAQTLEQRAQYLIPWLGLVVKKSEAEQDALLAAGRDTWKYRMETVRLQIKRMRGDEPPTNLLAATLITDKILAEAIIKKMGPKPEMAFMVHSFENPTAVPEEVDKILIDGTTYQPLFSKLYETTVLMPSSIEEYGTDYDLFRDIRGFIGTYLHLDDGPFKTLACCYVLMTWVHDKFDALPYLRAQGDMGTGKSTLLQTIGSVCYRPMMAGGATTPSPIFRIIDRFHGTLIIDEADFDRSDLANEIVKILNFGYMRGFPVLRSERDGSDNFDVKSYDCFGPKILATRRRFQDGALESRCLSHTMPIVSNVRKDMDLSLGSQFRQDAQKLRNKLLLWRFRHHASTRVDKTMRFAELELRVNQIIQPILACVDDAKLRRSIEERVREYSKMVKADRRDSLEGVVAGSTLVTWAQSRRPERFLLKHVVEKIRSEHEYLKVTDRKVSDILRRVLGVPMSQRGGFSYIDMNEETATSLATRYGTDLEAYGGVTGAPAPTPTPVE